MEEAEAAAYYDELTRKGEGAARFKQGLGFSSSRDAGSGGGDGVPARGSALASSSSFFSSFVRASSPTMNPNPSQFQKQKQLETIQEKLKKKPSSEDNHHSRHRNRSQSRDRDRDSNRRRGSNRRRSRSRDRLGSRSRDRDKDWDRHRRRGRERGERRTKSRSRSVSDEDRGQTRGRGRSRSTSPRRERRSNRSEGDGCSRNGGAGRVGFGKERNTGVDYSRLIKGYDTMTPAERVKAKMKLQLSETARKDDTMGSGWERFEFDKDAPLDDEEIEAVEDDAVLVKQMGQSFRFSAVEARNEDKIKAAHDEAMFGAPALASSSIMNNEEEEVKNDKIESNGSVPVSTLLSNTVLAKQQGSWRDRARKV